MRPNTILLLSLLVGFSAFGLRGADHKLPPTKLTPEQRAVHLLNRLTYGPRPGDVEAVTAAGEAAFIERQLTPERIDDGAVEKRLESLVTLSMSSRELTQYFPQPGLVQRMIREGILDESMRPRFGQGGGGMRGPQALNVMSYELRRLDEPVQPPRQGPLPPPKILGINPPQIVAAQLQAAKILRAVESERQLLEVMTDFWMNHFNVFIGKNQVRLLVGDYERDVIRPNALGKFRDLLGATAHSPAMLVYLDNNQSFGPDSMLGRRRKSGLNENYARELMELHTLGVDGGYTQQDVTEAARVLTGWTAFPGAGGAGFRFLAPAHDRGEKHVLGQTFRAGGVAEGEKLLDLLAAHPSTAKFLATKLVRRFVADDPPASLVDRVAKTYQQTGGDIKEMLRTIFYSKEFWDEETYRSKVKKPLELVASTLRAAQAEVEPTVRLLQAVQRMGEGLYLCQPPTGYPDTADAWLGSDAMVMRWNFALGVVSNRLPGIKAGIEAPPANSSPGEALEMFSDRFLYAQLSEESQQKLLAAVRRGEPNLMAAFVLGSPDFQRR